MNVLQIIYNRYSKYKTWQYSSTYMITLVCQAPRCQLMLVSIPCPTWAHDFPKVDPRTTYTRYVVNVYVIHVCFWISRKRKSSVPVSFMHERSVNNRRIDTAHIRPGSAVSACLRLFAKLPAASYCLCRYHVPRGLTTLHRWVLGKLVLLSCWTCVCSLRLFSMVDKLLSVTYRATRTFQSRQAGSCKRRFLVSFYVWTFCK